MNKDEPCAKQSERADEEHLRRALRLYEARLTEIADLTARTRHEINNPLTGLIGQTQLLLREELNEAALRRVQIIEQLAARIRDIVAELRVVQRPHPQPAAPGDETTDGENDPPRH